MATSLTASRLLTLPAAHSSAPSPYSSPPSILSPAFALCGPVGIRGIPRLPPRSPSSCQKRPMRSKRSRLSPARCVAETAASEANWVPVIPVEALPKGERRLVKQGGETILLLWYRNEIYAIENTSPAEGAYAEGFLNAKLTQDGGIVCPSTSSVFDLKSGAIKDWYPNNFVLRLLTKPLRSMVTYPVKVEDYQILVDVKGAKAGSAEVMFGDANVGKTVTDIAVDEVRMQVDETEEGFGFTMKNELINGRSAMMGFAGLLLIELTTGKGILATTGFLYFLYKFIGGPIIKY